MTNPEKPRGRWIPSLAHRLKQATVADSHSMFQLTAPAIAPSPSPHGPIPPGMAMGACPSGHSADLRKYKENEQGLDGKRLPEQSRLTFAFGQRQRYLICSVATRYKTYSQQA
jgi:hypothetical protein